MTAAINSEPEIASQIVEKEPQKFTTPFFFFFFNRRNEITRKQKPPRSMYTYQEGVQGQGQPEEVALKQGRNFIFLLVFLRKISIKNLRQFLHY